MAKQLSEVLTGEDNYTISLVKLTGQAIADVEGYLSEGFGDTSFKLTHIVMANGSRIDVEGEHDLPYLSLSSANEEELNLSHETLNTLQEESEK